MSGRRPTGARRVGTLLSVNVGMPKDVPWQGRTVFTGVWQYARRRRLLSQALDPAGATAIGRRFQLALVWLAAGALLGAALPVLGVVVIAAFNAYYWLPIRGENPLPQV